MAQAPGSVLGLVSSRKTVVEILQTRACIHGLSNEEAVNSATPDQQITCLKSTGVACTLSE